MDEFLRQCANLRADMSDISLTLNNKDVQVIDGRVQVIYKEDILQLDVSEDIRRMAQAIKDLGKYREENIDRDSLTSEDKDKINKKYDTIVRGFVYLRNKQIVIYNQKVNEINERIRELKKILRKKELSEDLKFVVDSLDVMDVCEEITDKDLQKNKYLDNLDYKKLKEVYENVSKVEEKLKTDRDASVDLWFLNNYIEKVIEELNIQLDKELDLTKVTSISGRMVFVYENIIDLDVLQELNRDKMDTKTFSSYSHKITSLKDKFSELEEKMFTRRKTINETNGEFKNYKFELQYLDRKVDTLETKVMECNGKCNSSVLSIFDNYGKANGDKLSSIKNTIVSDNLEQGQVNELNVLISDLETKNDSVIDDINNPFMLSNFGDVAFYQRKINNLNKKIRILKDKVGKLEKPITDKSTIKEIESLINERQNDIIHIERVLKCYKKSNATEEYNALKTMLDDSQKQLDDVYNDYRGKRPLKIKGVRRANKLFKKYKKIGLISTGLSSLAIMGRSFTSTLIPAIMHGNQVMGQKVPVLSGYSNFANGILGSFIGAKKTGNDWVLADGRKIDSNMTSTVLLKTLAVCGVGVVGLVSPVLLAIKKINEKMKKFQLKQKKSEDVIENKKLEDRIDSLLYEYENSGMSFDLFLDSHKLTEEEIEILEANIKSIRSGR